MSATTTCGIATAVVLLGVPKDAVLANAGFRHGGSLPANVGLWRGRYAPARARSRGSAGP